MNIATVILSAGQSTRMGQTKALLNWESSSFLKKIVDTVDSSKVSQSRFVVTGFDAKNVETEAERIGITTVFNPQFATGLMSSLQTAVRNLNLDIDAVLIVLIDQPQIESLMIQNLVRAFITERHSFSLARPFFHDRPGHPCLIAREYFAEILAQPLSDDGAAFLFKKYPERVLKWKASLDAVQDIDTPEDFERLIYAR